MTKANSLISGAPSVVLNQQVWDITPLVLQSRIVSALADGRVLYPIYRKLRFAAHLDLEKFFDDLALNLGWRGQRLDEGSMILDADGLFIEARGGRKSDYCSCTFFIWADSVARAEEAQAAILSRCEDSKIQKAMFSISWSFLNSNGELQSANIEELADDVLHDEAYPELDEGVAKFISDYLSSPETILVIQGNPGTGKTRLIRSILGAMTIRNGKQATALYTADKKTLESDEIFLGFITGSDDAFVIEDADHLLKPRADGNDNLHRFLTIADGVIRAQGRKIIFSTNLPNVGDLDDALIRPGRCFARMMVRELSRIEAGNLLERLCAGDSKMATHILDNLSGSDRKVYSLAEVYRAFGQAKPQEERP